MSEEVRALTFHGYPVRCQIVPPESQAVHRVLLLSSPMLMGFHYRKLLPELSGLNCLTAVVDFPGYGQYAPRNQGVLSRMLWGVLDGLDREFGQRPESWHLIGYGAACPLILSMANQQPDSVRSQVLLSPLLPVSEISRRQLLSFHRQLSDSLSDQRNLRRLTDTLNARPIKDYVFARMWKTLSQPGILRALLLSTKEPVRPCVSFAPVMALWGAKDPLVGGQFREELTRLYPEAEAHVFKTAGHFPTETHSSALMDYLRGWIRYLE